MKSKSKELLILCSLLLMVLFVLFYQFYLLNNVLKYADSILAAFMVVELAFIYLLLGSKKDKNNYLKKEVFKMVFIVLIIFFAITYGIGLRTGFLKNSYSLKLSGILNNIIAPLIVIITSEYIRYIIIFNKKGCESKKIDKVLIVVLSICLALVDMSLQISYKMFTSNARVFNLVTTVVIPALSKSLLLSYLTYHVGVKTSLTYRLIMDLYVFIVPVFPDFNDYINSMIGIGLPYLTYLYASKFIDEYNGNTKIKINKPKLINFGELAVIGVSVIFIALISSKFSFYVLAIASESMSPKINVGDAVLIHKVNSVDDIDVNDIIVYEKEGTKIVHRVTKKNKDEKGIYSFRTKGDANNKDDMVVLTIDDIQGKVVVNIPFIGTPAVWVSKLFS